MKIGVKMDEDEIICVLCYKELKHGTDCCGITRGSISIKGELSDGFYADDFSPWETICYPCKQRMITLYMRDKVKARTKKVRR